MNLGSFVIKKLASVEEGDLDQIVKNVASFYVNSAAGVGGLVTYRNQANENDESLLKGRLDILRGCVPALVTSIACNTALVSILLIGRASLL